MTERLRILFVDDEPHLLEGIVRLLRPMRDRWEVSTAPGGMAAMAMLEKCPADVVISDMRMPEMDGAQFLSLVAQRWPSSIRFILSGQSDRGSLMRSISSTHQYLAKPCDSDLLREGIERACVLRERLHNRRISLMVSKSESLPCLPSIYQSIITELHCHEPSIRKITAIVRQDIGMTTKLLQLVNSARFGVNHRVTVIEEVIDLLGLDLLRQLVLATQVFGICVPGDHSGLSSTDLWHHSQTVAAGAQAIARSLNWKPDCVGSTYTAGLLHDCGRLLLAMQAPIDYLHVRESMLVTSHSVNETETAIFGAGHPEVGAYLLGLWGLPDSLVEAVAYHHQPSQCVASAIVPLTLVHVAQAEIAGHDQKIPAKFDLPYLERCQALNYLPEWQKIIQQSLTQTNH